MAEESNLLHNVGADGRNFQIIASADAHKKQIPKWKREAKEGNNHERGVEEMQSNGQKSQVKPPLFLIGKEDSQKHTKARERINIYH